MSVFEKLKYIQLDVDPRMDDNASPMSSYWSMLRVPYLSDFSSLAQIKIQVKYQFQTFLRKI